MHGQVVEVNAIMMVNVNINRCPGIGVVILREEIEMTVSELIEFLKKQPKNLLVAYKIFSEQCLLEEKDIAIEELCQPRDDGWVHDRRPDKSTQKYLVFPR